MNTQLPDFTNASVLVVGDIMLDRYWFGETGRISPEAPVPVVKIKQKDARPGGAANVGLNLAALGANVTLLGITGKDEPAADLIKSLEATRVKHDIIQLDTIPTITKLRIISRHQQLIRLDFEEKFPLFDFHELIALYKKHLTHTNLVILSDYQKGTLACVQELIQLAKAANVAVMVDPKGTDFTAYSHSTVITPNFKEFETIVGPCQNEAEITSKGVQLLNDLNIESLLLTRGERGMTLIQQTGKQIDLPAHAREVFDVTGAGDTVIATLGAAIAAGADLPFATYLANLAASLAVTKLGAAAINAAELGIALTESTAENRLHGTTMLPSGVLNEDQLFEAVNKARLQNKRIVFTNGCFDILHAGHVTYLQQAKQLGDYLIVALNDDASVTKLKGANRPINPIEQRMAVLASLRAVDWVTHFADDTPIRLLKRLQPDILVKGGDYTIDQVVGAPIVHAYGGDVRVLSVVENLSTTSIIAKAQNDSSKPILTSATSDSV
jgi:D-beta-D-heptose 7-phosphate kinase/D-beta-D-heptose 1-phosphate adenosyltransferase